MVASVGLFKTSLPAANGVTLLMMLSLRRSNKVFAEVTGCVLLVLWQVTFAAETAASV